MSNPTIETLTAAPAGDVAAALDAARPNSETLDLDMAWADVITVRDDVRVETLDLEQYAPAPARPRGARRAITAEGFVTLTNRLGNIDSTAVYADVDTCRLVAVLNDDDGTGPGWRDHRITFEPRPTPEWTLWTQGAGLKDQDAFAAIIEAGESEIRTPSATVMLELAETFHASTSAKFKQAGRRRDGRTQLVYEEEIEATAGEGMVDIPDTFTIEVRPFYGADPVLVECRLRFRVQRGDLAIGYFIHRPDEIRRDSFQSDVLPVLEAGLLDGIPVIEALPADPPSTR